MHGPLKARISFDPIIRCQDVLTFNNPQRLGLAVYFLLFPSSHVLHFFYNRHWLPDQAERVAFVFFCNFLQDQCTSLSFLVKSPSLHCWWDASLPLLPTPTRALCQAPLWMDPRSCLSSDRDLMDSMLPPVKRELCVSKAFVFSFFPYIVFFGTVKQQL